MDNKTANSTNEPLNNRDNNKHLFRLGELDDYKVASGNPDVRGWALVDRDNQKLGTVNELIVDVDRKKVRYLDVKPSADTFRGDSEHRLLIPIGVAISVKVVLMVIFGREKFGHGFNEGNNRIRKGSGSIQLLFILLSQFFLRLIMVKYDRSVLGAYIIPLPV